MDPVPGMSVMSLDDALTSQGYDAVFDPEIDRKYVCPVCLAAMRDAMQTACGHRFCRSCVLSVVNGRAFAKCPVDNTWFRCEDELFDDNAVRREVLSLRVKCNRWEDGCEWRGELRDLEEHLDGCDFVTVSCPNGCGEVTTRGHLTSHMTICEYRLVHCQHCKIQVVYADLMKHQVLVCVKIPVRCTLCGQFNIQRENIPKHIDKDSGDCPHVVVNCQFYNHGCQFQDKRRNISDHYKEAAHHHMALLMQKLSNQEKRIMTLTQTTASLTETVEVLQGTIQDKNSLIETLSSQLTEQEERLTSAINTSYNGRIQWKIPMSGVGVQQFISQSFYTGCPGYKVCVCLELDGHKEGSESYTSLFMILEKGEYDDSLRFPFNSVCHVTVHDQSETSSPRPHTAVINCNNVPRCQTTDATSNSRRGRLRFMKTDEIKTDKYINDGFLYLDIAVSHDPSSKA